MTLLACTKDLNHHAQMDAANENLHHPKGFLAAPIGGLAWRDADENIAYPQISHFPSVKDQIDGLSAPPTEVDGDIYLLESASVILDVDTIIFQSGTTVRITFNGSPDLSGLVVNDHARIRLSANASNNGTFIITAIDDGSDFIEITNPERTDDTDDEASDSPATTTTTHRDFDAVGDTDWVKYFAGEDKWFGITPNVGVSTYNETTGIIETFGGTDWAEPSGVDLASLHIGSTNFSTYAAMKSAAVVGDIMVIPEGQDLDINDIAKDGVRIHLDGEINYTGGGTAGKAVVDTTGFTKSFILTGKGKINNTSAGLVEGRCFQLMGALSGESNIIEFNKATATNTEAYFSNKRTKIWGDLESSGGNAINGTSGNQPVIMGSTIKSTSTIAVLISGSTSKLEGYGEIISTASEALRENGGDQSTTFTGLLEGLTIAVQRTSTNRVVLHGTIVGDLLDAGAAASSQSRGIVFTGHLRGAPQCTTVGANLVVNGQISNPRVSCSDGQMLLNCNFDTRANNVKHFTITGGKVIWTGDQIEQTAKAHVTSTISAGSLEIRGGTFEGSTSTAAANRVPFKLSGTGELKVNGGRIVANANDVAAHVIEIVGTSAKLVLKGGTELITTNATAKDIKPDTAATSVHIHGTGGYVTNVAVADANVVEKVGTAIRNATDVS